MAGFEVGKLRETSESSIFVPSLQPDIKETRDLMIALREGHTISPLNDLLPSMIHEALIVSKSTRIIMYSLISACSTHFY